MAVKREHEDAGDDEQNLENLRSCFKTPNRLRVFKIANTARLGRGVGQERWWRMGAVRKLRGTLRQHVGCNAHENCVFCSYTPEMYKPPQQAFSPHIARGYTTQQNS
jgi:hypothetical protein